MPNRTSVVLTPVRNAAILAEAVRRIQVAISDHEIDLDALRRVLETEMAKGPVPLIKLMKVGRRRALDRISRQSRKAARQRSITMR